MSDTDTKVRARTRDLGALIIPAVLVFVGIFLVSGNLTMNVLGGADGLFGPQTFPWLVAALAFAIAAVMSVQILRGEPASKSADPGDEADTILDAEPEPPQRSNWAAILTVVGGVVLFILILNPIGWLISATLLFAIVSFGLGARNHVTSLICGLGIAATLQLIFSALLDIHIPPGILG